MIQCKATAAVQRPHGTDFESWAGTGSWEQAIEAGAFCATIEALLPFKKRVKGGSQEES